MGDTKLLNTLMALLRHNSCITYIVGCRLNGSLTNQKNLVALCSCFPMTAPSRSICKASLFAFWGKYCRRPDAQNACHPEMTLMHGHFDLAWPLRPRPSEVAQRRGLAGPDLGLMRGTRWIGRPPPHQSAQIAGADDERSLEKAGRRALQHGLQVRRKRSPAGRWSSGHEATCPQIPLRVAVAECGAGQGCRSTGSAPCLVG